MSRFWARVFWGLAFSTLAVAALACGGSGGGDEAEAPVHQASPSTIEVRGKNLLFDRKELHLTAGQQVTIRLINEDPGVVHNLSVYTKKDAREKIFVGEVFPGVGTKEYSFKAPKSGTYFFRCDAHPDTMTGTIHVN